LLALLQTRNRPFTSAVIIHPYTEDPFHQKNCHIGHLWKMGHTFWGLHCPSFQSKQTENSFAFAQKGDPKMPAAPFPARFPLCAEKNKKRLISVNGQFSDTNRRMGRLDVGAIIEEECRRKSRL
jgi:hypothetical protein